MTNIESNLIKEKIIELCKNYNINESFYIEVSAQSNNVKIISPKSQECPQESIIKMLAFEHQGDF